MGKMSFAFLRSTRSLGANFENFVSRTSQEKPDLRKQTLRQKRDLPKKSYENLMKN